MAMLNNQMVIHTVLYVIYNSSNTFITLSEQERVVMKKHIKLPRNYVFGIMYSVAVFQNMINDHQGVWHFCASHILDNVKHWWAREFLSPQQLQTTWNWQSNQLQHERPKNPSGNPSGLNSPSDINPENLSHEPPHFWTSLTLARNEGMR